MGVFSEKQTFDLIPNKSSNEFKPLVIFGGKNGSGKTTLLEAFQICLYGRSFKGQKMTKSDFDQHILSRLHRNVDGSRATEASIMLSFDFPRAGYIDDFNVIRKWKLNGSKIEETLLVQQNNMPLKEVNEEQWQDFLMELIPPGLSKLFLFDGEKIQNLALGQTENQHIISSINSLLGIELIEKLHYDVKTYIARESTECTTDFDEKLSVIKAQRSRLEHRRDDILQEKASIQNQVIRRNLEIENQELSISTNGGGFASQRAAYKEKAKIYEAKIESLKDQIRSLCGELLPFALIPDLCIALKNRLETEEKEQQRQATISYINNAINDIKTEVGTVLSFDQINLSKEEKQLVVNETIDAMKNSILKLNGAPKANIHVVSTLERQDILRWVETALNRTPSELHSLTSNLLAFEAELKTIREYIDNAPSEETLKPLFLKLRDLHEELGTLNQKQSSLESLFTEVTAELETLSYEEEKILEEKNEKDKFDRKILLAKKSESVLQEFLMLSRVRKINEFKMNFLDCFRSLIGKVNLVGDVQVAESTFNISLLSPQGIHISKSELSAGEKQIYAMAMIWALAKTSGRHLPFIIDTPLGRLDIDHRNNIIEKFIRSASNQIIIFSTNTEIDKPYFKSLSSYIAKAYNMEYDTATGKTVVMEGYFWNMEKQEA